MADPTPDSTSLVDMAHPGLPEAAPVRVTRRQLDLVWTALGWRETSGETSSAETPEFALVPSETAASRRRTTPAAEAAVKEN